MEGKQSCQFFYFRCHSRSSGRAYRHKVVRPYLPEELLSVCDRAILHYLTITTPVIVGWNVQAYRNCPASVNVCRHDFPGLSEPESKEPEVAV